MIARNLSTSKSNLRHEALGIILDCIKETKENIEEDSYLKAELKKQLDWLKSLIDQGGDKESIRLFNSFAKDLKKKQKS